MKRTTITIVAVAMAVAAAAYLGTSSATHAADTPAAVQTYQGRTALQWHKVALQRLRARDWYHSQLGESKRYARRLLRKIGKISSRDTVLTSSLERKFLCIHGFEGSWTDPNAPYWGGVQMDLEFMKTYGPEFYRAWGTADHWPVSVQIAVAMRAYLSGRGFHPWPNTARYCGLL